MLDPDVILRADAAGVQMGAPAEVRGATAVAGTFSGRALAAQPAIVDGSAGIVWAPGGSPNVVWEMTIVHGRITEIEMIATTETLQDLDLVILDA